VPKCPCEKPDSGLKVDSCEMLGCDMFPHFCRKFISDPRVQDRYMNGRGAMQLVRMKIEDVPKVVKKRESHGCKKDKTYDREDLAFALRLCLACNACKRRPNTHACCPQRKW